MIATILGALNALRSKAVQIALAVGFGLLVLLKARSEIRTDAEEDIIREMERADEKRAQAIRDRVSSASGRVRPVARPDDDRGFRD